MYKKNYLKNMLRRIGPDPIINLVTGYYLK